MNVAMWGKALRTIPRLSKEEWLSLDGVGSLIARGTVTPVLGVVILAAAAGWAAIKVFGTERPEVPPADYPPDVWPLWYAPYAFVHTRLFGLLFFVGLIVDALWHSSGKGTEDSASQGARRRAASGFLFDQTDVRSGELGIFARAELVGTQGSGQFGAQRVRQIG